MTNHDDATTDWTQTGQQCGVTDGREAPAILRIIDGSVVFHGRHDTHVVTEQINLELHPGQCLALVGESGSGKSVTGLSILRLLPRDATASGQVLFHGTDLLRAPKPTLKSVRGRKISMIYQEPLSALNPVYTIGAHLREALRAHDSKISERDIRERSAELLQQAHLNDVDRMIGSYPHEISGGQRQRAMIAMALAWRPEVLIADEPTTALDVTTQRGILDLIHQLKQDLDVAVLFVTHDMGVVADVADRVAVMREGRIVEQGVATDIFTAPVVNYTKMLLEAVRYRSSIPTGEPVAGPENRPAATGADVGGGSESGSVQPVVDARAIVVDYGIRRAGRSRLRAVDHVDLQVLPGETVGVVGESGSGKSTLANVLLGLVPHSEGTVALDGQPRGRRSNRSAIRSGTAVSPIFQDPGASLNPRSQLWRLVTEPLWRTGMERSRRQLRRHAAQLLEQVAVPSDWLDRYPHELSGGQRQRVCIARALSARPKVVIADEPTSALDVSVQAQILALIKDLQQEIGFACIFISHDLFVVAEMTERIIVMRKGAVVEVGATKSVIRNPQHAYTRQLIAAIPVADPHEQQLRRLAGA